MMPHDLLALLFGVLIGLSLGVIGGGGSILTVPILVYIMGQDVHAATATSLAVVGTTALVGSLPHWKAGYVSPKIALAFGAASIGGTFVGAWANHLLPGWIILTLFGLLMLIVALRMLFARRASPARKEKASEATEATQAEAARQWTGWLRVAAAGLVVGLMTGFFGVGGGFLIVPALVLLLGFNIRQAVGTSLVIIAITSAAALGAHLRYGGLSLAIVLLFVAGGALGALTGALFSRRFNERLLQQGFATLIAVIGLGLLVTNLPWA